MSEAEKLAKEYGCETLLLAYIVQQCSCTLEQAQEEVYHAMFVLDDHLEAFMEER